MFRGSSFHNLDPKGRLIVPARFRDVLKQSSVDGLMVSAMDGINNDLELSEHLIAMAGVALVPGTAFGLHGHVRLSIATSMENLENALDRIEAAAR